MVLYKVMNDSMRPIHLKIMEGLFNTIQNTKKRLNNPTEPDYISQLAKDFPDLVNNKLQEYFHNHHIQLKAASVFVHKQPTVRSTHFSEEKSVEIGDILFIAVHKNKKQIDRWALLLQAKIVNDYLNYYPENINQHFLYQYWPEFEYIRSGNLNGQIRKVQGPGLYSGAKYLLFNPDTACRVELCHLFNRPNRMHCLASPHEKLCLIGTAHPTNPLTSFICLGHEFFNFLFGNTGREFIYQPKIKNNWDQVITDLLDETAQRVSKLAQGQDQHRGYGICFLRGVPEFITTDQNKAYGLLQQFGNNDNFYNEQESEKDMPERGICTIEIVIDSTDIEE